MSGKALMAGLLAFCVLFGAALFWFQTYAYYERAEGIQSVRVNGQMVPVSGYEGIDAETSPLKLRGCFMMPEVPATTPAVSPEPLSAPFWFDCFDAETLSEDIASGAAQAFIAGRNEPADFDRIIARYPDGRAYLWRQINECGSARFEQTPMPDTCK